VCGNSIIDEPLEDCDGVFIASENEWDAARYNTGSDCTIDMCGKPNSIRPCQCPPPQVCGNGEIEEPEQCDLGFLIGPPDYDGNCDGCNPDCTCPPDEAVCGNNLLEYGEDCDGTLNIERNFWASFKTRKFGCTINMCSLPRSADFYKTPAGISYPSGEYDNYILDMPGVDDECQCPLNCHADPPGPELERPQPVRFLREINLQWTDECQNENARAYNVFRCTGSSPDDCEGGTFSIINAEPLGITNEYTDTSFEGSTFEEDKYHCYFVQGIYGDMVADNDVVPESILDAMDLGKFDSDVHCIKAGMEQCFEFKEYFPWAEEFCGDYDFNVRSTCDENNSIVMVDAPGELVNCREPGEGYDGSYVCVGPYPEDHATLDGKTKCVPESLCNYCNDPFGIFGFSSRNGVRWDNTDEFPLGDDFGSAPETEPDPYNRDRRWGYVPCIDLDICYMDYAYTNTNRFYSYTTESSCYDFKSRKACQEFNNTIGGQVCEWAWHPLYRELGIGICRTSLIDDQECERCHDPENEVFNRCDRESCALYGKCYYDKANLADEPQIYRALAKMTVENDYRKLAQKESNTAFYKCTHEREIACENYDSVEDCIGSSSPYSIEAENNLTSNVVIDVSGNMTRFTFLKTAGTNSLITSSDDFFSFGKCQWITPKFENVSYYNETGNLVANHTSRPYASRCIKNSDDSPAFVEFENRTLSSRLTIRRDSDCGGLVSDRFPKPTTVPDVFDCRKDFSSPVTTVPHYSDPADPMRISGIFEFSAVVFDESLDYASALAYPYTYACAAEQDRSCYPDGIADHVSREEGNMITYENIGTNVSYNFSESGFRSGFYTIRYFSEDVSHNIEEVREFPVFIDADPPNVVIGFSNTSFEVSEDVWRTNLTITLDIVPRPEIVDDDEFAFCDAKLYLGGVDIYSLQHIVNEYNNSWTRDYDDLFDDYYTYWYRCEDDVGNVAEANITFMIDGDKSITSPQPSGTFNHGDHPIGVDTGTNAECRYLYSVDDNPSFWSNRTFDPSVFDTMTPFDVTGAADSPTTIHRSEVNLGHGYHRYYVKCRMFNDGKIRGNNADQIRFAVDLEPPVSQYRTDVSAYNGWYNQDVNVEISCGDPPITGEGLDWSFGCDTTYYCIGSNCSGFADEFREFDDPFTLDETTYITYYSVDKGGNTEEYVEDVLFQIDKEPPEITVEFFVGEETAQVLVMNVVYRVSVSSSKPFISPAVDQPFVTYDSQPSKFAGNINLLPTADPAVWEGVFFLENINANRGYEGEGVFTAKGIDYHNVSGSATSIIPIDTKPPESPVVEPSLEEPSPDASDYQEIGYPVHYYNGTYYTNQNRLFITGYTQEYLDMIAVTTVEDVDTELIFTQTPTNFEYEDKALSGFEGRHEIKVVGDITTRVNNSMYFGIDDEKMAIGSRQVYGAYGMFYDITNLVYHGGDEQYTAITIYPGLEDTLDLERPLFFYDKENPSFWFGFDVSLASFKNTTFYLKSYDTAGNLVRYPAISQIPPFLTFFADPVPPSVVSHFPRDGSTSQYTFDIQVIVKEGIHESGLDEASIDFTINGDAATYFVEHVTELEAEDPNNNYYRVYFPASDLDDGEYNVAVEGADLATNGFSETTASSHWTFIVDRNAPAYPYFSLIGGFTGPPGDERWYSRSSPDFIVDFTAEPNPVTITDIVMEDSPTEGEAATCESTDFNMFRCSFTTPKTAAGTFWADYGVIIKAYKTLDDGTDSNEGTYGPFRFTVDDQAPDFQLAFHTRFMDKINLTVGAVVTNEHHPLYVDLEFLGGHYTPIHSSNNGSFYYFVWEVPDYTKDDEGEKNMTITISDFAQNSRSVIVPVYLDLTAPQIEDMSIVISHTVKIGQEVFTRNPRVTVEGTFVDEDIDAVWVMPGDFDKHTGTMEGKKMADIRSKEGRPESFKVEVTLMDPEAGSVAMPPFVYNFMLINQINNMTLYVRDKAGHVSHRQMKVITDIAPPKGPTFCLGEDWLNCIPMP
jgi:hypothetical protein